MLGHIFENLLEDNRDKGAFYTPKEIVQYMCKESLIQYLFNYESEQLRITNEDWKTAIEKFIRFHTVDTVLADKEVALIVNQKLEDIKVCDPAIGSGAFPIGMLQEIFEAKRFIYPYLKTNKDFKPAEVKKNIIQNSIYGVDLEKGAVDIAQLRFWLSLVVDELNPHPLPNLDYKIMQGNSLLESFEGVDLSKMGKTKSDVQIFEPERDLFGNMKESQMKMTFSKSETTEKIQQLIKRFFSIEKAADKKAIRDEINHLVLQHIEYNIELRENQLNRFINEAGNPNNLTKNAKKKYEGYVANLDKIQATKANLLKIQETDERPYFLWHLYFMDVFEQGGFDVMIGNPPYIQLQKMGKETDILQEAGFETFARTGDIYCLFYEKGIDLLKKNEGVLSYITSNSWMKTKYGEALRKFFVEKTNPIKLLNFEDTQIFPSATVEVNILITQKSHQKKKMIAALFDSSYKTNISIFEYFLKNSYPVERFDDNGWVISDKTTMDLKSRIEENTIPLSELNVKLYIGLLIGMNEAFVIDNQTRDAFINQNPKNEDIIRPILRGRDIKKYGYNFEDNWVIFSHNGVKKLNIDRINVINDYPEIYEHLKQWEERLIIRHNQGDHWTNMRNCAYLMEFEQPKIIWGEISDKPNFSYDESGILMNDRCSFMVGEELKFILVLLNSKLIEWYFNLISTTSGMGTNMWKHYKIKLLPIPEKISELFKKRIETIAEYLIYLNDPKQAPVLEKVSNEAVSQVFEDLVNVMVYELYFEEEMKAKEIDVLQFVTEKAFPDITQAEDPKAIIQKVYYELQQKDNPIRNRILVAGSRSETIARINAATS